MLLAANIQLKDDVDEEATKLLIKVFIKESLQKKEQPRILRFVDNIELAVTGKLGGGA